MVRKSELTASTFEQWALASMFLRVENRFRSRSNAYSCRSGQTSSTRTLSRQKHALPLFRMIAQRCDVLFPGAAVASITTASSRAGGARMYAGKQDALSCKINFPDEYRGSSMKRVLGWNARRSGMCSSFLKNLLRTREMRSNAGQSARWHTWTLADLPFRNLETGKCPWPPRSSNMCG